MKTTNRLGKMRVGAKTANRAVPPMGNGDNGNASPMGNGDNGNASPMGNGNNGNDSPMGNGDNEKWRETGTFNGGKRGHSGFPSVILNVAVSRRLTNE